MQFSVFVVFFFSPFKLLIADPDDNRWFLYVVVARVVWLLRVVVARTVFSILSVEDFFLS